MEPWKYLGPCMILKCLCAFPFWWREGNPGMCLVRAYSFSLFPVSLKFFTHVLGVVFPCNICLYIFHLRPQNFIILLVLFKGVLCFSRRQDALAGSCCHFYLFLLFHESRQGFVSAVHWYCDTCLSLMSVLLCLFSSLVFPSICL